MLRSGVERPLEIVGEALSQLSKVAPQIAARLDGVGKAIGLRNSLIHGYTVIDHSTIWRTVVEDLPPLREAVRAGTFRHQTSGQAPGYAQANLAILPARAATSKIDSDV